MEGWRYLQRTNRRDSGLHDLLREGGEGSCSLEAPKLAAAWHRDRHTEARRKAAVLDEIRYEGGQPMAGTQGKWLSRAPNANRAAHKRAQRTLKLRVVVHSLAILSGTKRALFCQVTRRYLSELASMESATVHTVSDMYKYLLALSRKVLLGRQNPIYVTGKVVLPFVPLISNGRVVEGAHSSSNSTALHAN